MVTRAGAESEALTQEFTEKPTFSTWHMAHYLSQMYYNIMRPHSWIFVCIFYIHKFIATILLLHVFGKVQPLFLSD